ncbi:hypothetical protein [Calothrix rhizosoleniae]|uniref:hypothetical protein n=1 Tax=Calothrix rhizosoleniae TaxID=888997 RepID=UPI000B4A38C3|nr:hypothetical protein [Calothrix rhizosoleniae]
MFNYLQRLLLRQWIPQSGQWLLANTLGGFAGAIGTIVTIAVVEVQVTVYQLWGLGLHIGFIIYTAITGAFLMRLLQHPMSKT